MQIVECEVPVASVLDRRAIEMAYFRDSYRVPLRLPNATVVDIFFGIFGHRPSWMNWTLLVRNRMAVACGLEAPTATELLDMQPKSAYRVGDKIGPWPIFALTPNELVAGRNNKHLDFRLSILKEQDSKAGSTVISTVCTAHNQAGKVYLFFIVPFHRWGVKQLIRRAIAEGRI